MAVRIMDLDTFRILVESFTLRSFYPREIFHIPDG